MSASSISRTDKALAYFHQGYNCSQSVFTAFADICRISENQALMLASPFGAGIGRMREVCGAFCGLSLLAGQLYGNTIPSPEEKEKIFALVQHMAEAFKQEFGTIYCKELLHLTDEQKNAEGTRPQERSHAYYAARPCERCVAFCAELGESLLKEYPSTLSQPHQ